MFKYFLRYYIYPVATLSCGAIGVGFLSLPYVAKTASIWLMLFYFVVLTALILLINLIFGQISLKTPDFKRFPGFVGYYLGNWGKTFAFVSTIFGSFGVLLVYLIVGAEFLTSALQPIFGQSVLFYAIIYFVCASVIVLLDISAVKKVNLAVLILLFLSIIFIFIKGFWQIKLGNIFGYGFKFELSKLLLPYGPIMFALWGSGLIPEVEEMLGKKKNLIKKIIIASTFLPAVFYVLFVFLILGICGSQTTEMALTGLKSFLNNGAVLISLLIGFSVTFIAFISQGITLKKVLKYDLKVGSWQAFIITCFTPMALFLMGLKFFIPLISFIGGVLLSINGILILLMYKKIGGRKIIIYPLSLVFFLITIYEIVYFIK